jgi:CheY-like chemotaxis protein
MSRPGTRAILDKNLSSLVLVVDDNPEIRSSLKEVLEEEGYRVAGVADGREALDYLRTEERPQLILLDLMMPVMDGWQFRAEQRKNPTLASIPVIVISAMADAAGDIGAERVLSKPLSPEVLLGAVERYR